MQKSETDKPFRIFGPSGETRTRGILLPKQARYQLRYTWILYNLSIYVSKQELCLD